MTSKSDDSNFLFYLILTILLCIIGMFSFFIWQAIFSKNSVKNGKNFLESIQSKKETKKPKTLMQMIGNPKPEYLDTIFQKAKSSSSKDRLYALRALQYYGTGHIKNILLFLKDPEARIRKVALQIIGDLSYFPAMDAVLLLLKKENKISTKIIGFQTLGKICNKVSSFIEMNDSFQYLLSVLNNSSNKTLHHFANQTLISMTRHHPPKEMTSSAKLLSYWESWLKKNISINRRK